MANRAFAVLFMRPHLTGRAVRKLATPPIGSHVSVGCRMPGAAAAQESGYGAASTPSEIVLAVRQIPEALPRDLVDRVTDGRLNGRGAIVAHADQPMPG